jgi:agmatinase
VRDASTLFSFGHTGADDHEDDRTDLGPNVRIVDIGDADIVHTDTERRRASIAPGTGTPAHGGFLYYEVPETLQAAARAHETVGIDLVQVAPDYDPTGSTAIPPAQLLPGFVFDARGVSL